MGLSASKQTAPARIPTDRVIPFRYADDQVYTRGLCLDVSLCFDDVLDPEKLRESLETLLKRDDWRKLGARLRLNKDNKLEYHVPAEYSSQRPAFLFTTDKQDMPIADHPVLSKLPRSEYGGNQPALLHDPNTIRPYTRAAGASEYLDHWLYADIPQLVVHVVAFHDATILTVTFLHTLSDVMGFASLMQAWTAVLRGDEDQIPPLVGFGADDDPTATLHEGGLASRFLFADKVVKGWDFFLFVVKYILQFVWWPKDTMRMVYVPGAFVTQLREKALAELADQTQQTHSKVVEESSSSSSPSSEKKPFLSESDLLLSWWMQIIFRALNPSPRQTVCLMNVFDTRGVLSEMGHVPSPAAAVLGNATYPSYSFIPAGKFLDPAVPLSWLASRVRNAIETQRTAEQVQAFAAGFRECVVKTGQSPLYGDSGMFLAALSNWNRAKLFQLDFSGAVVADGKGDDGDQKGGTAYRRGRPWFVNSTSTEKGFSTRNAGVILGKDGAGNWWVEFCLRVGAWEKVRELL